MRLPLLLASSTPSTATRPSDPSPASPKSALLLPAPSRTVKVRGSPCRSVPPPKCKRPPPPLLKLQSPNRKSPLIHPTRPTRPLLPIPPPRPGRVPHLHRPLPPNRSSSAIPIRPLPNRPDLTSTLSGRNSGMCSHRSPRARPQLQFDQPSPLQPRWQTPPDASAYRETRGRPGPVVRGPGSGAARGKLRMAGSRDRGGRRPADGTFKTGRGIS